jgi:cytidylate kinase
MDRETEIHASAGGQEAARITNVVTIDGPAGAGKSTVARRVAEVLGFAYLNTGAMYRAATWNAMHRGVDLDNPGSLAAATQAMDLDLRDDQGVQRVIVDGQDISEAIRTPEVTREIYHLDRSPDVRTHLVEIQRACAAKGPTVVEGRDMGTVVFPHAKCKVFLVADLVERTRRRMADLKNTGDEMDFETLSKEIAERDHKDSTRAIAPLCQADDAHVLDTTSMSIEAVAEAIVDLARAAF